MNRNQLRMLAADQPVGDPRRGPPFGERCDPVTIGTAILGSVAGKVVADAFTDDGGRSAPAPAPAPAAPVPPTPTVMPTPDDEAMKAAQRRQMATTQARRGRQSTILSDPSEGGDLLGS